MGSLPRLLCTNRRLVFLAPLAVAIGGCGGPADEARDAEDAVPAQPAALQPLDLAGNLIVTHEDDDIRPALSAHVAEEQRCRKHNADSDNVTDLSHLRRGTSPHSTSRRRVRPAGVSTAAR